MGRLLNDEELMAIIKRNGNRGWSIVGSDRRMTQDQDIKTLKAVGEWLEGRYTEREPVLSAIFMLDIDQLKQGKMPE